MKHLFQKITALFSAAALLPLFFLPVSASRTVYQCDVSMDGTIGAEDARLALRFSVGLQRCTVAEKKVADADEDGGVTPADARLILRVSVGLERISIRHFTLPDDDFVTYADAAGKDPDPNRTEEQMTEPEETTKREEPTGPEEKPLTDEAFPLPSIPMPEASPESGTFTLTSYGWGDGVGMSQYGAVGMAKDGYTYKQILQHYFTGVKIVKASSWPEYTNYLGTYYDTEELIARMVKMEIYGAVDEDPEAGVEALKAQAVALFSLLEYFGFETYDKYAVGVPSSSSYAVLPKVLRDAVSEVMGEYIALSTDASNKPLQALFFATAALRTASAKDVWGYDYPHLQAVNSPYDVDGYLFSNPMTISKSEMRGMIMDYDSSIRLSSDPSEWIRILEHSASIDDKRGYVTKVQVGDRVMDGYTFCSKVIGDYFWVSDRMGCSTAFYLTYTP